MLQAIALGLFFATLYGLFLFIRGMIRLHKEGEKKLFLCAALFFVVAPLIVCLVAFMPEEQLNIWFALPAVLLGLIWISTGYFLESYLRKQKQMALEGRKRPILARPPHWLRNSMLCLASGAALWAFGALIGIKNATVETCALCVSCFLLMFGLSRLWRYRGF